MQQKNIGFLDTIGVVFSNRHQWRGAASKAEFWKFQLFLAILSNFFILPLDSVVFSYKIHSPVSSLWLAFITYINICLTLRRLYDSGVHYRYGIIGLGIVIGLMIFIHGEDTLWWFGTALLVVSLIIYVWLMLLPSWDRDTPRGIEKSNKKKFFK